MPVQIIITINDAGQAQIQTNPALDQSALIGFLNDMAKSVALTAIAQLSAPAIEVAKPEQFSGLLNGRG